MEIDWIAVGSAIGSVGLALYGIYKSVMAGRKADKSAKTVETFAADGGDEIKRTVRANEIGIAELRNYTAQALESLHKSLNEAQQERDYLSRELDKVRAELAHTAGASAEAKTKAEHLQHQVTRLENDLAAANRNIEELVIKNNELQRRLETGPFRKGQTG